MIPLEEIFCFIDDFCKCFQQHHQSRLLPNSNRKRNKPCRLTVAEIMTILVLFQLSSVMQKSPRVVTENSPTRNPGGKNVKEIKNQGQYLPITKIGGVNAKRTSPSRYQRTLCQGYA